MRSYNISFIHTNTFIPSTLAVSQLSPDWLQFVSRRSDQQMGEAAALTDRAV